MNKIGFQKELTAIFPDVCCVLVNGSRSSLQISFVGVLPASVIGCIECISYTAAGGVTSLDDAIFAIKSISPKGLNEDNLK